MKTYVAYCRVSTSKEDQLNSFENQQNFFRQLSEYPISKIYADEGLSGTSFRKRPQFNTMLMDAGIDVDCINNTYVYTANINRKPKFDYIVVTNTSRFARNTSISSIIQELNKKHVFILFYDLHKSTENSEDMLLLNMLFSMDEQVSRDMSSKVINGNIRSANRTDIIHTNSRLYGYKLHKEENRLEIIEHEAEVIRLIYKLYLDGLGQKMICNELTRLGYTTRQGKQFETSTINNILKNRKYTGVSDRLKYIAPRVFSGSKLRRNDESNVIYRPTDKIPQIVSTEDFNKVQEIRATKVVNNKGRNQSKDILGKKIICQKCGGYYTKNVDRGRIFYNCSTKKRYGVSKCNAKNVSYKKIMELITDSLVGFREQEMDKYKEFIEDNRQSIDSYLTLLKATDKSDKIHSNEVLMKSLEEQQNKLLDLYLDGNINKDILDKKSNSITLEINRLKEENDKLSTSMEEIQNKIELLHQKELEIVQYIESIPEHMEIDEFIRLHIEFIYAQDNGIFLITKLDSWMATEYTVLEMKTLGLH